MIARTVRTARMVRDGWRPVEAELQDNDSGTKKDSGTRERTAR